MKDSKQNTIMRVILQSLQGRKACLTSVRLEMTMQQQKSGGRKQLRGEIWNRGDLGMQCNAIIHKQRKLISPITPPHVRGTKSSTMPPSSPHTLLVKVGQISRTEGVKQSYCTEDQS